VWTSVSLQGELYLNAFHHFFRVLDSLQCTIDDALKYVLPYPGRMIGTHLPNELFFQKNLIWKMLVLGYIFQYSFIFSIKKKLKKINFLKFWHFFFGIILCQTCYLATVFGYHINNLWHFEVLIIASPRAWIGISKSVIFNCCTSIHWYSTFSLENTYFCLLMELGWPWFWKNYLISSLLWKVTNSICSWNPHSWI
jgi:hypothetical protein